jgi:hypothetical protein
MGVLHMPQAIFELDGPGPTFELFDSPAEGVSLS